MKTLVFYNTTELDPAAFRYMGLSVKEKTNSFGMFGTGLKYALATLLRLGDTVEIITKGQRFFFTLGELNFRGKEFNTILCNGEELGLTTELGKMWKAWMAYRELRCNALDEDGGGIAIGEYGGMDATTRVIVRGDVLAGVHDMAESWFLDPNRTPIWTNGTVEIYSGSSDKYFYQGVCVGDCDHSPYTINFLSGIHLSEDRLDNYSYSMPRKVGDALQACANKEILRAFLGTRSQAPEKGLSESIRFEMKDDPTPEFVEAIRCAYRRTGSFPAGVESFMIQNDKEIRATLVSEITSLEQRKIDRVIEFLGKAGCNVAKYPIEKIKVEGRGLLGKAENLDKIIVTEEALERGVFDLALTVLEEFAHCESGASDFTRGFQDYLFKLILTQMEARIDEIL